MTFDMGGDSGFASWCVSTKSGFVDKMGIGEGCIIISCAVCCLRIDCGNAVVSGEDVSMGVSLDTFITCVYVSGVRTSDGM